MRRSVESDRIWELRARLCCVSTLPLVLFPESPEREIRMSALLRFWFNLHGRDCSNHDGRLPRFRFAQISSVLSFFNAAPIASIASCEYRLCTDLPILNSL